MSEEIKANPFDEYERRLSDAKWKIARLQVALKPFADLGVGSGPDYETEDYKIERSAILFARVALEISVA